MVPEFTYAQDEWCHLTITYDHQKERVYKNGQLVYERDRTGDLGSNTASLSIGNMGPGNMYPDFTGLIDEFAIFDRALPQDEISAMYDREITPDASTLVLLHFNNDPSFSENESFIYDHSGNNFHGIPVYRHIPEQIWEGAIGPEGLQNTSVPVLNGDFIYFAVLLNGLYAWDVKTGTFAWQKESLDYYPLGHDFVYSNGIVYTDLTEGVLTGYDGLTGEEVVRVNETAPFLIVRDNIAYLHQMDKIKAVNLATGALIWEFQKEAIIIDHGTQAMVLSGDILFVSYDKSIYGLDITTGENLWQFNLPFLDDGVCTGMIIEDNTLYLGDYYGSVFAFEEGYANPSIVNPDPELPGGEVNMVYRVNVSSNPSYPNYKPYTFFAKDGQMPFTWEVASGSLPQGLQLVSDADNYNANLEGTPLEPGDFTFTAKVTDSQGNSDQKEFTLRIQPEALEFTMELQNGLNGYDGCEDTLIDGYYSATRDTNYGNRETLTSSYGITEWYTKRGLIKFKIFEREGGLLPNDAVITKAELTLYKADDYGSHLVSAYRLLKDWKELEATWNNASATEAWSTPGAGEEGVDRSAKLTEFTAAGAIGFQTFDITPLVEGYDQGVENKGWLFTQPTQMSLIVPSSEYTEDPLKRPKLTLTYKRFDPTNKPPVAKIYTPKTRLISAPLYGPDANPDAVATVVLDASVSYDDGEVAIYKWSYIDDWTYGKFYPQTIPLTPENPDTPWLCPVDLPVPENTLCSAAYPYYCLNFQECTYKVILEIWDDYGIKAETALHITVYRSFSGTTITTTVLKDGEVDTPYSATLLAEGGSGYVWSVTAGNLPDGLGLDSSGNISGTPTVAGSFNFTVEVSGTTGGTAQEALTIDIKDKPTPPGIPGDVNGDGVVDIKDLILVARAFNTTPASQNWNPNADVDNDSAIGIRDLIFVARNWGRTLS
jgi:hypothetical protein